MLNYSELTSFQSSPSSPIYMRNEDHVMFLLQPFFKEQQYIVHCTLRAILHTTDDFPAEEIQQIINAEIESFQRAMNDQVVFVMNESLLEME